MNLNKTIQTMILNEPVQIILNKPVQIDEFKRTSPDR